MNSEAAELTPLLKSEMESRLATRFGDAIALREKPATEFVSTGLVEIDEMTGGLPRGAITELLGPVSSGRTTLLLASLRAATERDEVFALVDANDSFDPASAAGADVGLDRLLWVRCSSDAARALKAVDLLLQSGGFGLVVLDLGGISTAGARQIPSSWWHRFRRAIENTPTCLLVIEHEPNARSCSSLALELSNESATWSISSSRASLSPTCSTLLSGVMFQIARKKPMHVKKREARIQSVASHMP